MYRIAFITVIVGFLGGCTPAIPMSASVDLARRSSIEQSIDITRQKNYLIEFRFSRDGVQFEKLKELVGAMGLCQIGAICSRGIAIPVRWSLQSDDKKVVASGELATIDSSGWASADVSRLIGNFSADTGRYSFKLEILKDVPELAFLKTRVVIYHRTK